MARATPPRPWDPPPDRPPLSSPPIAHRRRHSIAWWIARWTLILGIWGVLAIGVTLVWFSRDLPRPEAALDAARAQA